MRTEVIRAALGWLAEGALYHRCPSVFGGIKCTDCAKIFPRVAIYNAHAEDHKPKCPCHLYTHTQVVRKAKQIIKGDM